MGAMMKGALLSNHHIANATRVILSRVTKKVVMLKEPAMPSKSYKKSNGSVFWPGITSMPRAIDR